MDIKKLIEEQKLLVAEAYKKIDEACGTAQYVGNWQNTQLLTPDDAKKILYQALLQFIDSEIERKKGMKKKEKLGKYCKHCGEEIGYDRAQAVYFCGTCPFTSSPDKKDLVKIIGSEYNQAINEDIAHLEALKDK